MYSLDDEYWDIIGDYEPSTCYACSECVNEPFLEELINKRKEVHICDFCKKESYCLPVNELLRRIEQYIEFYYEDASESSPVDHGEYCFFTQDGSDLIIPLIFDMREELQEHIIAHAFFLDHAFCRKIDGYGDLTTEHLIWSWNSFKKQIQHHERFFFWNKTTAHNDFEMPPHEILNVIAECVNTWSLISCVHKNTAIYRARHFNGFEISSQTMGAPQPEKAQLNRMSPVGIPLFYGCSNPETTIKEIALDNKDCECVIGKWIAKNDLLFLDLSKSLPWVSDFDSDNLNAQLPINFLRGFLSDVNKTIPNEDKEIDYIPTQVLSEYFRCVFKTREQQSLSGIIYPSQKGHGLNYAFFFPQRARDLRDKYEDVLKLESYSFYSSKTTKLDWVPVDS